MAGHVCPWWVGYLLITPLRRIYQPQEKVLGTFVKPGMTVLDVGPGMGYFSLWMARAVTSTGRVVCVDVQQRMINGLKRRAAKQGLEDRIDARLCSDTSLGIDDLSRSVDFALAFAVAHEVPDASLMLKQIHTALRPGGRLLLAEPSGHVTASSFRETEKLAVQVGYYVEDRPRVARSRSLLLTCSGD